MPLPVVSEAQDSAVLKYDVNGVLVGGLKQKVLINNPTSHKIRGGQLFLPLVTNKTALHYVVAHNVSSSLGHPEFHTDSSENLYAYWHNITIAKDGEIAIEVSYDALSFSTRFVVNSSLVGNCDESSPLFKKYTQSEEFMQCDNMQIVLKAQEITRTVSNAHEKALRIYDFVVKHVRYRSQDHERGALWALVNGTGDCSEYSYLFVSLCRAAGIPARTQTGFAFSYVGETTENGHMWTEYYLEGYGWIPVDPTWKQFDSLDYRHFSSLQGIPDGLPYANIFFNYTSGPDERYLKEEQNVSLKLCNPNAFEAFPCKDFKKAVATIKQTKLMLSVARILGISALLPDKAEEIREKVYESQIHLQDVVTTNQMTSQTALSYVADALDSSQKASKKALELLSYLFAIIIGIILLLELVALIFIRQRHKHFSKKNP